VPRPRETQVSEDLLKDLGARALKNVEAQVRLHRVL